MIQTESQMEHGNMPVTSVEDLKDSLARIGLEEEKIEGDNGTDSTEEHSMGGSISSGSEDCAETSQPLAGHSSLSAKPLKSALKHDPELNPPVVCVRRKSWKTLPVPDLEKIQKESLSSSLRSESVSKTPALRRNSSSVSFKDVQIRDYNLTVGDNPSVSYGPPLSLDWEYEERSALCINEYEESRPARRSLRQMALNYYQRTNILTHTYGHSEEDFKEAKKEIKKVKKQRSLTRAMVQFHKVEDFVESASRKAKRAISGSSSKDKSNVDVELHRQASI
jgi:hypothetical protein|mmetsp:Transcript_6942/g.10529  ORF Transcript_6942/g.10529 Transcript_6942/m.10529 type:complete len:279 (-) Transcript_6942:242-1078(-)|eukprot:CAMPEP_0195282726 /NCGR_PEP_ID=MMETSP0707-20130614/1501_1 /TAXON_ID=33640 /ORGANISM="Asterionellopsis glacialis, Strain CCMP134" /LENGTH=278 /DNA_ID=CAMNT_0040341753 /DNA_START=279 /DNA_END=1115 /DNA_ORIENTATION=-